MEKGSVLMEQQDKNQTNSNSKNSESTIKDNYSNQSGADRYGSVEPLPESSRPRRDGPGGEDAE